MKFKKNFGNNRKDKRGFKNPRNRKTKSVLVFDEKAREEYLTGFKKRKDERRRKGHEQAELMIKEERKRLKQKRKEFLEKKVKHQALPPDLAEMARQHVTDLQNHTVTITDISEVDLAGQGGLRLGINKFVDSDDEEVTNADSDNEATNSSDEDGSQRNNDKSSHKKAPSVKEKKKMLKNLDKKIQQKEKVLKLKKNSKGKKRKRLSKKRKHKKPNPASVR